MTSRRRATAAEDDGTSLRDRDGAQSPVEPLDEDEQEAVIADLERQHQRGSLVIRGLLGLFSGCLCAMVLHELWTTEFDPADLFANSHLALTMTRRRACTALLCTAASYALATASFLLLKPRLTSKLATVAALVPLAYLSYICFVVTKAGFVRLLWLPAGGLIFGLVALYVELERRDMVQMLDDLKAARYHFKKA